MDSGAPVNAGRRGATGPSGFRDCGPGVKEGEFCLSRRRRPAAAHDAARRTAESGAGSGGETWLVGIAGRQRPSPPSLLFLGQGGGARPQTPDGPARPRQAGLNPTPSAPAPCTHPVRRAPGSGPGPWPSTGATARAQKKAARSERETRAFPLPPGSRSPRYFGAPARPRRLGSTWASSSWRGSWSKGRTGHPLGWSHHRRRPSPGGHTEALRPSLLCPGRKGFPLQSTKAKRPGRALKSPGLGRGPAGGSGPRWRGPAPGGEGRSAGADEHGGGGCRTAATCVLAEKFCSQVGEREIVTL
ncbi:uncharacterized protein [Callorhinus ursinus]|uniref:uncharacterized protein n=1 Tax=Callorhinus ursinus TaxID=34884 RepID=UPI003CD04153